MKPRRRPAEPVPEKLFFISYYDGRWTATDYFTEEDYTAALVLLGESGRYTIEGSGEFKMPEPIGLNDWKDACGFSKPGINPRDKRQ